MEDKTEDSDVFEIVDFTTASDWERFTSRLEEIIHEWKLANIGSYEPSLKSELDAQALTEVTEEVSFADFPFVATYCSIGRPKTSGQQPQHSDSAVRGDDLPPVLLDLVNPANDFPAKAHCLTRWYGLHAFVVLAPKAYAVTNESRINMLLSSVAMAINNSGCQVPIFVQVHEKWRRLYLGHFECSGLRTMFEMVHLKHIPPKYSHLSGLVELFKAKLNTAAYPHPRVSVVIRLTYSLSEWPDDNGNGADQMLTLIGSRQADGGDGASRATTEPTDQEQVHELQTPDQLELLQLPFGACDDPISELYLAATWPDVDDDIITESEVYSDLDPLEAPVWSVRVKMAEDPQCLLSTYLAELSRLCGSDESSEQALGRPVAGSDGEPVANISTALERLTETHVPISIDVSSALHKVVSSTASQLQKRGANTPIPETDLTVILQYLFPDAKDSKSTDGSVGCRTQQLPKDGDAYDPKDVFSQYKTAPTDSLLAKLAVCLCVANYRFGGLKAVAHLWQEFVLEMRYRWENSHLVPGMEQGSPNLRHCILYQKIQMLNCCIERTIARQQASQRTLKGTARSSSDAAGPIFGVGGGSSASLQSVSGDAGGGSATDGGCRLGSAVSEDADGESGGSRGVAARTASASSVASIGTGGCATDDTQCHSSSTSVGGDQISAVRPACEATEDEGNDSDEFFECDEAPGQDAESMATAGTTKVEVCEPADGRKTSGSPSLVGQGETTTACGKEDVGTPSSDAEQDRGDAIEAVAVQPLPAPEGRLRCCGDLMLLGVPGEALYIPDMQEPAPMTEDMLAEHAEVLTRLGTTAEGASLRARMQSASLLSDMESFKAANPGCLLEDFVRWYSPRDFIVDTSAKNGGMLSDRMLVPGNMWAEVWSSARAVPARRQRRLFDDTKEAEKVLHYLAALKPGQVVLHVLPLVVQAAIIRLKKDSHVTTSVRHIVDGVAQKGGQLSRHTEQSAGLYSDALHQIRLAEIAIARAQSLLAKFPPRSTVGRGAATEASGSSGDLDTFAKMLLDQPEVTIVGGAKTEAGAAVAAIFRTAAKQQQQARTEPTHHVGPAMTRHQGEGRDTSGTAAAGGRHAEQQKQQPFGTPAAKEYILRAMAPCPAPCSRPSPQRLYCTLLSNETRLAGAFTLDTTFQ